MEQAAASATRRCHARMDTTRGARVAVAVGLEHARLGREQLGVEARQTVELGIAVRARGRASIARTALGFAPGHTLGPRMGARGTRAARETRAVVGTPGTPIIRPPPILRGMAGALGIFGRPTRGLAGFGSFPFPLAMATSPSS